VRIPLRPEPPGRRLPNLIETGLQQPQQSQGDQLDLKGPLHGLLGPGAAFLHAQALLVVAELIFVSEARGPGFHDLRGRPIQDGGDQKPGLPVASHLDHEHVDGDRWPIDSPATPELFVLEGVLPPIDPGPAPLPADRPVHMILGGGQARPLHGLTSLGPGPGDDGMIPPGICPQAGDHLDPPLVLLGCQARPDHSLHSRSPPLIAMMKPPNFGHRNHPASIKRGDRARLRAIRCERQMRSKPVVIGHVCRQQVPQMRFVQHDDLIGVLPTNTPDEPFDVRILPWRARCHDHFIEAHLSHLPPKGVPIDAIAISEQVSWRFIPLKYFHNMNRSTREDLSRTLDPDPVWPWFLNMSHGYSWRKEYPPLLIKIYYL
jgi:hypothetical protein